MKRIVEFARKPPSSGLPTHVEDSIEPTQQPGKQFFNPSTKRRATQRTGSVMGIQSCQPSHSTDQTYDYEVKYKADPVGSELEANARVWKVYLDEAENFDNDMLHSFHGTVNVLLVFAGLFSAAVTTFLVETSSSLQPNYAQVTALVLIEQTQLLRTWNITAMNNISPSGVTVESVSSSTIDVWVNALFFLSLVLSLIMALLAVMIKQWLQVYSSTISGDAKARSIIRQFRFTSLKAGRVPELIAFLPILLYCSLAIFLAGLSLFAWGLHHGIALLITFVTFFALIIFAIISILPSIWIGCPYRIPFIYYALQMVTKLVMWLVERIAAIAADTDTPSRNQDELWQSGEPMLERAATFFYSMQSMEQRYLGSQEAFVGSQLTPKQSVIVDCLSWLYEETTNPSVRTISMYATGTFLDRRRRDVATVTNPSEDLFKRLPLSFMTYTMFTAWHDEPTAENQRILHIERFLHSVIQLQPQIVEHHFSKMAEMAIVDDRSDIIKFFLNHGMSLDYTPSSDLGTLLFFCTSKNCTGVLDLLLANGANVNSHSNPSDQTALHCASCLNHKDIAVVLLEKGADINAVDQNGATPLHVASQNKNVDIARILISHGANVQKQDNMGHLPLHLACEIGLLDLAAELAPLTDVRICDRKGQTALHSLCNKKEHIADSEMEKYLLVAKILFEQGVDVSLVDNQYFTPASLAAMNYGESADIVVFLRGKEHSIV